jgi:hypothetical protein
MGKLEEKPICVYATKTPLNPVGKYLGENGIIVLLNICMRKPLVRKNSYIRIMI